MPLKQQPKIVKQKLLSSSQLETSLIHQQAIHSQKQSSINNQQSSKQKYTERHEYENQTNKNTLIKGSLTSQSQQSVHSANTIMAGGSNFIDLDFQGKGLRNFELNLKQHYSALNDKKQQSLRSINLSQNCLQRFPQTLEKSLQFLNVSHNKLKSLIGIEACINLKFLNASHNLIASAQGLVILQSLRELVLGNNQISLVKEIGQLKNLVMLDLSHNKLIDIDKITPLQSLKKIHVMVLQGNLLVQKVKNYEEIIKKLIPSVQVIDPDIIKDFSQFQEMEAVCFPQIDGVSEEYDGSSILQMNEKLQLDLSDKDLPLIYAQSSTPHNLRENSQLLLSAERNRTPTKISATALRVKAGAQGQTGKPSKIESKSPSSKNKEESKALENYGLNNKYHTVSVSLKDSKSQTRKVNETSSTLYLQKAVANKASASQTYGKGQIKQQQSRETFGGGQKQLQSRSRTRERSSSNNIGGKKETQSIKSSNNMKTASHMQILNMEKPSVNEKTVALDKRISANVSLAKAICAQGISNNTGRVTPNQRQSATSSISIKSQQLQSKKIFNRTTNISALDLTDINPTELVNQNATTTINPGYISDRQSQASLKTNSLNQSKSSSIMNKKQVGIAIPVSKLVKYSQIDIDAQPLNQSQGMTSQSVRPVTSLKQRASTSQSSKEHEQSINAMLYNPYQNNQQVPLTTRNQDQQKFKFDDGEETKSNRVPYKEGRLTPIQQYRQQASKLPTNNHERGTSSTQLQRFINASKSATRQQAQTPAPDATQSVKTTNLPPRAYQSRLENPGDKMTKAGESLSHSIISSSGGHHKSNHHNLSNHSQSQHSQSLMNIQSGIISDNGALLQNAINHNHQRSIASSSSRIMQTGGTLNDADEEDEISPQHQKLQQEAVQMVQKQHRQQDTHYYQINQGKMSGNAGCSSGGSMSPVCEEEQKNAESKKQKKL